MVEKTATQFTNGQTALVRMAGLFGADVFLCIGFVGRMLGSHHGAAARWGRARESGA
jgi:hypothetical protein